MLGRVVDLAALPALGPAEGVGLLQVLGRFRVGPLGVAHVRQAEEQGVPPARRQVRVGQQFLHHSPVGVGQFAAQDGRQPAVRPGMVGVVAQRCAQGLLRFVQVADLNAATAMIYDAPRPIPAFKPGQNPTADARVPQEVREMLEGRTILGVPANPIAGVGIDLPW